jgi:multidrug resistance efflux pump
MTNNLRLSSSLSLNSRDAFRALALVMLVASLACQSRGGREELGIIIVNAPATGEVRRVLVREGMSVSEGTPVVEIAVRAGVQNVPQTQAEDPQARAGRNIAAATAEIEAARAEVVRTEVEVQRLTPLVASGGATQGQLDGARAEYDRAQQRLQRAQAAAQDAQSGLVAARQQSRNSTPAAVTPSEQIVAARASSAGTVSAINARVGERVTAGQPLATLRAARR